MWSRTWRELLTLRSRKTRWLYRCPNFLMACSNSCLPLSSIVPRAPVPHAAWLKFRLNAQGGQTAAGAHPKLKHGHSHTDGGCGHWLRGRAAGRRYCPRRNHPTRRCAETGPGMIIAPYSHYAPICASQSRIGRREKTCSGKPN